MASIFKKADPKDPAAKRWVAKVKVGDQWKNIALRLLAVAGTKRLAEQRANDLQLEVKAGLLSGATREWMGDAADRLAVEIGRGNAKLAEGSPDNWHTAALAWLRACDAKDSRSIPEGRVKAEEKTKKSRKYKLKSCNRSRPFAIVQGMVVSFP